MAFFTFSATSWLPDAIALALLALEPGMHVKNTRVDRGQQPCNPSSRMAAQILVYGIVIRPEILDQRLNVEMACPQIA
ncbi:hypothetical protein NKJ26_33210 [Mesorhizobium sp. M0152]|uniref:hypothetical protein n=1 Tax=Mesorhizobium sp. M0152 TaxID=2956898 RepID=UPI003337AB6B